MFRPLCLLLISASAFAAEDIRFNRDIRPILSENCFYCHGQDPKHREADLRLDVRDEAVKAHDGVTAIVPGKPEQSEMLKRLLSHDPDDQMPPPESNRKVTPAQIELIRRWIAQGAPYEKHWSFVPPQRAPAPKVADASWARQPFDRFVLAKLEAEGISPSAPASPAAWLRRASFDLTGLPPTPAEIKAFEAETTLKGDAAYAAAADRLLASPRFGERQAQEWLDVARYADTHGFNNDSARSMWRWRDYVIESFNANLPFDRFVTEQLAGDLLPKPTLDQKLATAFNRNHVINSEGGIIDEEYRVEYVADRVRTTSTALLGLTMECARCHDHKYDPVSQKDYYRMFAFFNNVFEYGEDGRVANAVPLLVTPTREQQADIRRMDEKLATLDRKLAGLKPPTRTPDGLRERLEQEDTRLAPKTPKPTKSGPAKIPAKEAGIDVKRGTTLTVWFMARTSAADAPLLSALDRSGNPAATTYGNGRELRLVGSELEWTASQRHPAYATIVRTVGAKIRPGEWHHVAVRLQGKENAGTIALFVDGEELPTQIRHDGVAGTPRDRDWLLGADGKHAPFDGEVDGFRTYPALLQPAQIRNAYWSQATTRLVATQRQDAGTRILRQHAETTRALQAERDKLWSERLAYLRNLPTTMVMEEMPTPRQAYVLTRGNYDAHGEKVDPGMPEQLIAPWPKDAPRNRLGLARWFLQPQHPLTARVVVNRLWAQLFGAGLVKSVEDFGTQGEWPSHPEVLDTLARDFVDGGWDVKKLFRSIVLSSTYRQTSDAAPALYARDPENRLLARGPRVRLTSEQIRDQALAVSGLLAEKIGGPSVRPYQPEGLYKGIVVDAPYPSTTWELGKGDELYRRSLYTFWKRTVPHPAMLTFDSPDREFCSARRSRTNTPLQALVLWNETGYLEASRKLAERMLKEGGADDAARTAFAFRLATGRAPRPAETEVLVRTLSQLRADFAARPDDAAKLVKIGASVPDPALPAVELAAAAGVANLILTLDETIT
ncbi:MAG: DUF1553 domain-containing protein, partial [Opitutales bacterium]